MASSWLITNELRYRVTWQPLPEFCNDLQPRGIIDFEMGGTTDSIELIQVVRDDSQIDQSLAEFVLNVDRVINAA